MKVGEIIEINGRKYMVVEVLFRGGVLLWDMEKIDALKKGHNGK